MLEPASYRDIDTGDYFLLDAFVSTKEPIEVTGPSASDFAYMREDSVVYRYREVPIALHALSVDLTPAPVSHTYIFPAPLFPAQAAFDDSVTIITFTVPVNTAAIVSYAPQGTAEYDDILNSATGVDGSGTQLSDIYSDYAAFFFTDSRINAEILVNAFNSTVIPQFSSGAEDEFLMGSRLPIGGDVLSAPSSVGLPISAAEISERTDMLEIIPTCPIADEPYVAETLLLSPSINLKVTVGNTESWRTVTHVDGKKVYLNSPLPFGTPQVRTYGLCAVDLDSGEILQVADPFSSSGADALSDTWNEEVTTHMHTGGSLRPIDLSDKDKHIVLWGYTSNDSNYSSVLQEYAQLDLPITEQDFLDGLIGPERHTFGQFLITSVTQSYLQGSIGQAAVPTKVQIEVDGDLISAVTSNRINDLEPKYVFCAFVVTELSAEIDEGEVLNIAQVTAYDASPSKYSLVGTAKNDASTYLIQPIEGAPDYPYELFTDELEDGTEVTTNILSRVVTDEPTTVETMRLIPAVDGTELRVATTNSQTTVAAEAMSIDGVRGFGYELTPINMGTSKSGDEDILVSVPVTAGTISPTLAVTGYFDSAVGQAQALLSSDSERAICANLLAKTFHSGYIGVTATYVGGPTETEAETRLRALIKSQLAVEGAINRSMISSALMSMNASSVSTPIDLYVCFEDNGRRVHKRTIHDYLRESTLFNADVTLRTLYTVLSTTDVVLGASIQLTRKDDTFNMLGLGGS